MALKKQLFSHGKARKTSYQSLSDLSAHQMFVADAIYCYWLQVFSTLQALPILLHIPSYSFCLQMAILSSIFLRRKLFSILLMWCVYDTRNKFHCVDDILLIEVSVLAQERIYMTTNEMRQTAIMLRLREKLRTYVKTRVSAMSMSGMYLWANFLFPNIHSFACYTKLQRENHWSLSWQVFT